MSEFNPTLVQQLIVANALDNYIVWIRKQTKWRQSEKAATIAEVNLIAMALGPTISDKMKMLTI